ncbi:MAG TPA: hypothetical protein VFV50_06395, partial [Bdellovibrionales bacterium]|nr:hypothetical protein [Bdellovibrionales bacterium]
AWRKANPGADVLDAGFVEMLVRPAMEALGRRNELAAEYNAQGLLRIIFTEQHLEEFAYLSSVNAVLVQQAAWLAESVKPKKPQDAFGDKKVRAVYQAFVERFLEHLDTARGDEALGRAHAIMQAVASPLLAAQK